MDQLTRHVRPVPRNLAARRRFTATELATYLECPRRYELQHLHGLPHEEPAFPGVDADERLSPAELGDMAHRVLRIVGTGGEARLDQAIEEGLGLEAGLALRVQADLKRITGMVTGYLRHPVYAELMRPDARLRTEMTVAFPADGAILEGVIDALVEGPDGALHLLDYKTGAKKPEAEEFQVGLYCQGVQIATGRAPATARIVYLREGGPEFSPLDPTGDGKEAREQAIAAIEGLRAGRFEPAKRHCASCSLSWACGENPAVRGAGA